MSTRASSAADGRPDTTRHEQLSTSAPLALVSTPQATFTVTTLADVVDATDGVLSLREAVGQANATRGQDTVTFAPALAGGTIRLTEGSLTITDHLVIDGDPLDRGAGGITIDGSWTYPNPSYNPIRVDRADVRFEDLTITNGYGYGITANRANVEVHRVAITGNYHPATAAGIDVRGGTLLVADSMIRGNTGETAIAIQMSDSARVTVRDSDLGHSTGHYSAGITGSGTLAVERSTIAGNIGDSGAGIDLRGSARVVDSTFTDNGTPNYVMYGSAIHIVGSLELINSTITETFAGLSRNYGHRAAAVSIAPGSTATITNSTITGTTIGYDIGDGIGYGIGFGDHAVLRLNNSIVDDTIAGSGWLNSNGANIFRDPTVAGATETDVLGVTAQQIFAQTKATGNGLRAGVLADNGGPTMTVALLDSESNPALNAARTNVAPGTDQRGFLRDALPDIGAFELDADSIPPATLGPIAAADSFTIDGAALGKKSASFAILANDIAQSGKLVPNSVALMAPAAHGAASLKKGVLIYKPEAGFEGTEQLTYTVQDNDDRLSNVATVTIQVTQPTLAAAAADAFTIDGATVPKKGAQLDILANDTPGFGKLDAKSVTLVEEPSHGSVTVNKGRLLYQPEAGFEGTDEITYTVADATGRASNPATVTLTVTQPGLSEANADAFTIDGARVPKNGARLDILTNDTPGFGKLQPNSVEIIDGPENGTMTLNKGTLLYKPEAGFEGMDAITYTVADATGRASNAATVTLTVTQPELTEANADAFTIDGARVPKNGARLDILANDTPGFGKLDARSVTIIDGPENGTMTLNKGTLLYKPEAGFEGTDAITYTVADATGRASNPATATIEITQPPLTQAQDDSFTLDAARIGKNGARLDILVNDMPGFGKLQPKSVEITDGPENGTVRLNKGVLFYTPDPDFDGTDLLRYTVTDATGRASNEATVRVTVDQPAPSLALADLLFDAPGSPPAGVSAAATGPSLDILITTEVV